MRDIHRSSREPVDWVRRAALALALLWGGFWSWFGLASGISEGLNPLGVLIHTAVPGLIFLAVAAAAWRWRRAGGLALLLTGLLVLVVYPILFSRPPVATIVFLLLTMAVPPVLAGFLLLFSRGRTRES